MGVPPFTLIGSKGRGMHSLRIEGNTQRTVTIDGVEYVVPEGITLLEYIESSGTQYIDTGINPAGKKIGAVIDFQFTDTSRATGGVFGSNKTDGKDNCQFTVYTSKWRVKLNSYATYGANYDTNRHTVRCNMPDGTSLDGTVYTSTQYTIASGNTNNVFVGACNYGSSSTNTYTLSGKLYPSRVYDNTTLLRAFHPAKNASNEVGMLDLVSGQFFPNAGTGIFIAGNELPTPDFPLGVKGVGDRTENLFDSSDMTIGEVINADGSTASSSMTNHSNYIAVEPNTAYIIKDRSLFQSGANQITRYHAYGSDKSWLSQITFKTVTQTNMDFDVAFTTPANCHYVRFTTRQPLNNQIIMLVKGSTAPTSYIPYGYKVKLTVGGNPITIYTDKPLNRVGNYADVIDAIAGVKTDRVGVKVFDGTENFVSEGILDNCWTCTTRLDDNTSFTDRTVYCTHFKHSATLPAGANRQGYALLGKVTSSGGQRPIGKYVGFGATTAYPTLAEWQAFLAAQYAAGTPVTVWYPLVSETTGQVTAQSIVLPRGEVILDSDNVVKAGRVGGTYQSQTNA